MRGVSMYGSFDKRLITLDVTSNYGIYRKRLITNKESY